MYYSLSCLSSCEYSILSSRCNICMHFYALFSLSLCVCVFVQEPDFAENEMIYDDLDLDEAQSGMYTSTSTHTHGHTHTLTHCLSPSSHSCAYPTRYSSCSTCNRRRCEFIAKFTICFITRTTLSQDTYHHEINITSQSSHTLFPSIPPPPPFWSFIFFLVCF